jgi:hypothetical protein
MPNYKLGKIYKLIDNTNGNIYVGSTCEPMLSRRLAGHVKSYKAWQNGKYNYVTSFEVIKNNNYDIVLIEAFPCNDKEELHKKERYFIESMKCINKYIPTRTGKESNKEYYLLHADEMKKQKRTIINCLCGASIKKGSKAKHEKTEKHKSYIANQNK